MGSRSICIRPSLVHCFSHSCLPYFGFEIKWIYLISLIRQMLHTLWSLLYVASNFFTHSSHKSILHSSRMRIARLLPASPSMHCAGRFLLLGESALGGVCYKGVCSLGMCLLLGEGSVCSGGCLLWGDCVYPSMHWGRHPPPWTEWLTDRCKNITFANVVCGRQ